LSDGSPEQSVLAQERALQAAMLASDVDRLDRLLHADLLAVGPHGQLADKAVDLQSHRTGVFRIAALTEEEVRVKVVGRHCPDLRRARDPGDDRRDRRVRSLPLHAHVDERDGRLASCRGAHQPGRVKRMVVPPSGAGAAMMTPP
jgi:Domain of unknown function (DUF4440)